MSVQVRQSSRDTQKSHGVFARKSIEQSIADTADEEHGLRKSLGAFDLIKVAIVLLVIVAGLFYIKASNYKPFIPSSGSKPAGGAESTPSLLQDWGLSTGSFGIGGVVSAAALVFFAFIGFDVVATTAEETKKPKRDLPIGIFGSLAIITVLYVAVSIVITGMVKYNQIKVEAPLASAFRCRRQQRLRGDRRRRRGGRPDHGGADAAAGPNPGLLRHEPRQAPAACVQRS